MVASYPETIVGFSNHIYFSVLIIDVIISFLKKRKTYRLNDTLSSVSAGVLSGLVKLHFKWLFILPYTYVYRNFAIYRVPTDSLWALALVVLAIDLAYYCGHRATHTINIGWIAHATHHSSEELNFSTAIRQSMLGHFFFFIFYLPMALFCPPQMYAAQYGLNMIYQFWIHCETVGKLHPWVEFIFNTPSHHRVHHARNPQYIDKNYAGVFIVWDRMFGTFEEEKEQPVYGLVHQLGTWDILWAQLHHVVAVAEDVIRARGITNKILIALCGPGWTLGKDGKTWISHEIPAIDWKQPKYDPYVPRKVTYYVGVQYVITFLLTFMFSHYVKYMSFNVSIVVTIYSVFCLEVYALTLNRSTYSQHLEVVRIFVTFGLSLFLMQCYLSEMNQYKAVLASGLFIGISLKSFEAIQPDWNFMASTK